MRQVATFLLCCVVLTAGAAEIWRWKDANGVVHYSDKPMPGAERMGLSIPVPTTGAEQPAQDYSPDEVATEQSGESGPRQRPITYTACTVTSPAGNETFRGVQPISVVLDVQPGLQPGHSVRVLFDNSPVADWPAEATQYTLAEVFRGSHTLSARILDATGRPVCAGAAITFHLLQESILPPAGRAPRPRPRTTPGG
jgi:hypothetical protein